MFHPQSREVQDGSSEHGGLDLPGSNNDAQLNSLLVAIDSSF